MNELRIFNNPEFGEIRTLEEGGKVLFCGSDVAKALGYKKPSDAVSAHCRYTAKRSIPHPQNPSKAMEMLFIPEGDIYRLAAKSELPGADKFESWIFDEVLPSLRKHGAYMTPETIEQVLTDPDTIIRLATDLKAEREQRKLLEHENVQQKQLITEYEPKIEYLDKILQSKNTLTVKQIAADYDMSAQELNKILHEEHVQYNVNGQWLLYREHQGMGYTKSKLVPITRASGTMDSVLHTQWTQKGRLFIHNLPKERGIMAVIDRKLAGEQIAI